MLAIEPRKAGRASSPTAEVWQRARRTHQRRQQGYRLDPKESAYPWNLAAAMGRLGLNDLALAFMTRAIHLADIAGESDWSGADAHLALAELAIDAEEPDLALTALARARALDDQGTCSSQIDELLGEISAEQHDPHPHASLAELLQRLAA